MKFIATSILFVVIGSVAMAQSGFNVPLGYRLVPNNAPFAPSVAAPAAIPVAASPYRAAKPIAASPYAATIPAIASPYKAALPAAASPYGTASLYTAAKSAALNPYAVAHPAVPLPYIATNQAVPVPYTATNQAAPVPYTAAHPAAPLPYTATNQASPVSYTAPNPSAGTPYRSEIFSTPDLSKSEVRDDFGQNTLSYVTANGIKYSEQLTLKEGQEGYVPVKEGSYEYTSPEGIPVSVGYKADENGFVVTGFALPFGSSPAKA